MIEFLFTVLILIQLLIFSISNLLYFFFSRVKNPNSGFDYGYNYRVALVIPCYNEEHIIKRKLINSLKITHPDKPINIYVVDDGSTDNTLTIVEEFIRINKTENLHVWKHTGKNGKARALNWVFGKIEESIVVITDVDVILEKNALVNLIRKFEDPKVGAITGKILINKQNKKIATNTESLYRRIYDIWRRGESNLHSCSVFNGPLMAFRKQVLEKVKINENTYADDTDLLFKTIRLGYRAIYEHSAQFYESADPSFLRQIKRKIRRATGLTHTLLENLSILGRYGYFGKVVFPISLSIHIIFPILSLISVLLFPLIVLRYPILLLLALFLLIPVVRIMVIGFLTSQLALVIGLVMPRKGRWETVHTNTIETKLKN